MKILVGPDSFKDSVTAHEFCQIAKEVIHEYWPDAEATAIPLADGGEGTVDALTAGLGGKLVRCDVTDPLGHTTSAKYGLVEKEKIAIIEMAQASGLPLVPLGLRNPMKTTTYGTGELILDAVNKGMKKIILGIGGSATSDAGLGMLQALGFSCLDQLGKEVPFGADGLNVLAAIIPPVNKQGEYLYKDIEILVACDVTNPLYGKSGAAYVYGPQKGATDEMIELIDSGLKHFADVVKKTFSRDIHTLKGAGAAGGLGACLHGVMNAKLLPGFQIIREQMELDTVLKKGVDLIITAEGQVNHQSFNGKLPIELAKLGKTYGTKTIIITGSRDIDLEEVIQYGVIGIYSIENKPMSLEYAMENGKKLIKETLKNILITVKELSQNKS